MQLNLARVCLDCEEVHDGQQCPVCASESFAYVSRWVPRLDPRPVKPAPRPIARPSRTQSIVFGGGVVSLLAYGLMHWKRRAKEQVEAVAFNRDTGELR
jgi:hypothetical protein